jgi:hypothetical protein
MIELYGDCTVGTLCVLLTVAPDFERFWLTNQAE